MQNKTLVEQLLDEQRRQQAADAVREAEHKPANGPAAASGSGNAGSTQDTQPAQTSSEQPGDRQSNPAQHSPDTPKAGDNAPPHAHSGQNPGRGQDDESTAQAPQRPAGGTLDSEQRQALEQWLRQVPDDPSELLRRKFWYEQQQSQDTTR